MDRNDGNNHSIYTRWWGNKKRRDYKLHSAGNRWINGRINDVIQECLTSQGQYVDSVTDIGSGDGSRAFFLSKCIPEATIRGIDFVQEAVDVANKSYGDDKKLKFECVDASGAIDISSTMVSAFGVLEHIPNWKTALDGWLNNPDIKYFLCYFPTGKLRKNEKYVGHVNAFHVGEVEHYLEEKGWKALAATYGGFPFYSPIMRTLQYMSVPRYEEYNTVEISGLNKIFHDIVYFLFRYCSCQKTKGDEFIGLFERE
ncbi:class I SAM-dependent methyltransferase [Butyrivibrio sp. AE2005]|jgi:hypothetical protein|uniref:class I SAM-dependent methyltransferase n=1 Tax=Butyrivibrio sp. AE2005 TaxID=1496722 RepID=UPI00068E0883|nr:class I SAM-dependent methyltransferase [Butyrivibrio sp. AE2005]